MKPEVSGRAQAERATINSPFFSSAAILNLVDGFVQQ